MKLLLRYGLLHMFYEITTLVYFTIIGRGIAAIRGKLAAIKDVPKVLKKRKDIQRNKKVSSKYIDSLFLGKGSVKIKFKKAFSIRG